MHALFRWLHLRCRTCRSLPSKPPESLVALWDHPWPEQRLKGLRLQRRPFPTSQPPQTPTPDSSTATVPPPANTQKNESPR